MFGLDNLVYDWIEQYGERFENDRSFWENPTVMKRSLQREKVSVSVPGRAGTVNFFMTATAVYDGHFYLREGDVLPQVVGAVKPHLDRALERSAGTRYRDSYRFDLPAEREVAFNLDGFSEYVRLWDGFVEVEVDVLDGSNEQLAALHAAEAAAEAAEAAAEAAAAAAEEAEKIRLAEQRARRSLGQKRRREREREERSVKVLVQ
jgi:hypothetical protein